jgi:hypothetical protein
MKNKLNVAHVYGDLLSADADPNLERLVGDLHSVYTTAAPPANLNAAITRAMQQRVVEQQQRAATRRVFFPRWMPRGVGAVAALLLAMVLLGGGAYALGPILSRAFAGFQYTDLGLQPGKELDLSQTINGYTIHLQSAYADANRVVIGYTISGPEGQAQYNFYGTNNSSVITTASGTVLPWYYGGEAAWDMTDQRATQAMIMMFDAAALTDPPAELNLRLDIGEIHVYTKDTPIVAASAEELKPAHFVSGPFSFEFTVPFSGGQIFEVNQTVTVETPQVTAVRPLESGDFETIQTVAATSIPVTLQRVVIAPSETRAYFRFPAAEGVVAEDWTAFATFSGNGWTSDDFSTILPSWTRPDEWGGDGPNTMSGRTTPDGQYVLTFGVPLHEKHGEWMISIPEIFGADQLTKQPDGSTGTKRIEGPWEFKFVVP